ncbi:DUF4249 domain-containing protein [Bacteroides sp. 519]|uniref:DUF4249 domain-containing protein n=1 Tax=Bacteroides sp. 519 TaxID=2302937 RepID=UPI0013D5B189|nr:DUF4249 domain-containing protein [Bacteroides sp. 519]NDV57204.1 DUF4249 domain-containing protein [Bacteroides sp. 519]
MKKHIVTLFLLLLLLLTACENDIPFRSEGISPKLTMNGFINTDSPTNILYLNYTGKINIGHVDDATVEVYINNELNETAEAIIPEYEYDKQKRFSLKSRFKPGDKVRIEARTADGKHHAWVEETVPDKMDILQLDTINVTLSMNDMYSILKRIFVFITFKDRENEKNHYRIVVEQHKAIKGVSYEGNDTIAYETAREFWPWNDLVLTEGQPATPEELDNGLFERVENKYGVFDDNMFQNKEYTMTVQTWFTNFYRHYSFIPKTLDAYLTVRLLSITEAEYYYLRTLNHIDSDIYENYLDGPPIIPGNVKNGVGIVGFSSESAITIPVIKDLKIDVYEEPSWD